MLDEHGVAFEYRDYRTDPLSQTELRRLFRMLGLGPRELLRTKDRAFKELGLSGDETDAQLTALMADHPTLLQRPIGVRGSEAVVGRPPEALLRFGD